MKAEENPHYLEIVAQAVRDFVAALEAFLELHIINTSFARGMLPAVVPRDDASDQDIRRRAQAVDLAAGRAAPGVQLTNVKIGVQGVGMIDPITAWGSMTKPKPLLEPDDVVGAANLMLGRLEAMILRAKAEAPPEIGAEAMHPLVWGAAEALWRDGHYRHAVAAAAEALVATVKARTGRTSTTDTGLWQQAFSAEPPAGGDPRLRWPGDPADRSVSNMNDGLRQFAPGVQMLIRNAATHTSEPMSEQEALERLATISLLARWVSKCDLVEAE